MQDLADGRIALDLFRSLDFDLVPRAVIAGVANGSLYVDSVTDPRMAILWDGFSLLYLAGNPSETEQSELPDAFQQVLAQARCVGMSGCLLHTAPRGWEWELNRILPTGATSTRYRRALYVLPPRSPGDAAPRVPEPLLLEPITEAFLARSDPANTEGLQEWLRSCWASERHYIEHGFGYCLMQGSLILSWCAAEYVTGGHCGLGVETHPDYRGRGYATLTAQALAAEAHSRGIVPYWDSWASNRASLAVADKVGFQPSTCYPVYWLPL